MTVLRQHDGLVEPGLLRLGLRERRIDVRARDLASRRDRVVISAAPARDTARDTAVDVDVCPEGNGEDGEGVLEVVQPDADERARFVRDGPDVRVLAVAALSEELEGDADQVLCRVGQSDPHDPAGAVQTLVVLLEMEAVELAFLGIPVGADPLEDAGSVIERMGEDAHLRVAHRDKRSIEEGPRGIWRGATPKRGRSGQLLHHAHTPCPDRFRVELGSATRTPRADLLRPL